MISGFCCEADEI